MISSKKKGQTNITLDPEANVDYNRRTNFLYGEQTWGRVYGDLETEFSLSDKSPVNHALKYIHESLDMLKITPCQLRSMHILDIGTGRQAVIFSRLGAKKVFHFDISKRHIDQTRKYCTKHHIRNITSVHGDLTKDKLLTKQFDFAFAAGIYQHIQIPARGMANFAQSLKINGQLYMGFYRSGDWRWFISAMIREGIKFADFWETKNKITAFFSLGKRNHFQVGRMLDDFFVPSQNCFHPRDILADLNTCGLKLYNIENDMRDYNHEGATYFTVGADRVYATKIKHVPYEKLLEKNFKTAKGIDQLYGIEYKAPLIKENIYLWFELINLRKYGIISAEQWRDILVNLYRFARPWEPRHDDYYIRATKQGRDKTLNEFLQNLMELYNR